MTVAVRFSRFGARRPAIASGFASLLVTVLLGCSVGGVDDLSSSDSPGTSSETNLACPVPDSVEAVGTVVVGHSTGTFTEPYVEWGIQEGCFAQYGLTVENVSGTSQAARIAGLVGGSMDIVSQTPRLLATAYANGDFSPLVISSHYELTPESLQLAREVTDFDGVFYMDAVLIASPESDIQDFRGLEGARVALYNQRGTEAVGLSRIAEAEGFSPESMVLVELDYQDGLNALLRGDVDAAILTPPLALNAIQAGGRFLGSPTAFADLPGTRFMWITTPEIFEANPEALDAFRRGMWDVYRLLEDDQYAEAMKDFLVDRYELDPALRDAIPLPDFTPRQVTLEELQQWVPELIERGDIEGEVTFDSSVLMPVD